MTVQMENFQKQQGELNELRLESEVRRQKDNEINQMRMKLSDMEFNLQSLQNDNQRLNATVVSKNKDIEKL